MSVRAEALDELVAIVESQREFPERSVRLRIGEVPVGIWEELDAPMVRRFPNGGLKIDTLTPGVTVEYVPKEAP